MSHLVNYKCSVSALYEWNLSCHTGPESISQIEPREQFWSSQGLAIWDLIWGIKSYELKHIGGQEANVVSHYLL